MKNWKTTLVGAALAVLTVIASHTEGGASLTDWKTYLIPSLLALFGYLAKDAGVTGSVKALVWLLLPAFLFSSCVNNQSTDAELRRAQAFVDEAAFGYQIAEIIYRPRLESSKWSPAEKAVAQAILDKARQRLAAEQARLVDIQMRRAAAVAAKSAGADSPPANLLLPALPGA